MNEENTTMMDEAFEQLCNDEMVGEALVGVVTNIQDAMDIGDWDVVVDALTASLNMQIAAEQEAEANGFSKVSDYYRSVIDGIIEMRNEEGEA